VEVSRAWWASGVKSSKISSQSYAVHLELLQLSQCIIPNFKPFELDLFIKLVHSANISRKNSKMTGHKICEFFVKINRCREILFVYPCPSTFHVHLSGCSKITHFCNACRTYQNESRLFYIKNRFSNKMLEFISKTKKKWSTS